MNRREFLVKGSQVAAASQLRGRKVPVADAETAARPNVIWLIADQLRGQALGVNGDPNVRTPNIDLLALTGVNFRNARSNFPLCCPARGTMLTSRYAHHMVPGHLYPLPKGQTTIANIFNDAGYHTGYIGKWHLDGNCEFEGNSTTNIVPPDQRGGFKKWIGYENNNNQWNTWVHGGEGATAFQYKLPKYETDSLTDLFVKHIEERAAALKDGADKPFFAVLSVQPPHDPYVAPPEYMGRFNAESIKLRANVPPYPALEEKARQQLAGYYAGIENFDDNVGRIVEALREKDLLTNTHIMVFSDHGNMLGSQGQWLKENPYEESSVVPMIFGGFKSSFGYGTGTSDALFSTIDIAPTTLGLCGIAAPEWMEGHDFSGRRVLSRPKPVEVDSVYLQVVHPSTHPESVDEPYRGLVTADGWKYVCFKDQSWLMFNLSEDPYELVNVAFNMRYRKERAVLINRLKQWVADTKDEFVVPDAKFPAVVDCPVPLAPSA